MYDDPVERLTRELDAAMEAAPDDDERRRVLMDVQLHGDTLIDELDARRTRRAERLIELAGNPDVREEHVDELDDAVHELFSRQAADVNNSDQVRYLVTALGVDDFLVQFPWAKKLMEEGE